MACASGRAHVLAACRPRHKLREQLGEPHAMSLRGELTELLFSRLTAAEIQQLAVITAKISPPAG